MSESVSPTKNNPPASRARARFRAILRGGHYAFLLIGLSALAIYGGILLYSHLYQAYLERSFKSAARELKSLPAPRAPSPAAHPGDLLGQIEIDRIRLSVMVLEGVDEHTLQLGAGHIPGTAFPGNPGNVGIAAHRDTFFRALQKIRKDDRIRLTTREGSYEYRVESLQIVNPDNVGVLAPSHQPLLTLVTCYPFHYIGAAPKRFIVRAQRIAG